MKSSMSFFGVAVLAAIVSFDLAAASVWNNPQTAFPCAKARIQEGGTSQQGLPDDGIPPPFVPAICRLDPLRGVCANEAAECELPNKEKGKCTTVSHRVGLHKITRCLCTPWIWWPALAGFLIPAMIVSRTSRKDAGRR